MDMDKVASYNAADNAKVVCHNNIINNNHNNAKEVAVVVGYLDIN